AEMAREPPEPPGRFGAAGGETVCAPAVTAGPGGRAMPPVDPSVGEAHRRGGASAPRFLPPRASAAPQWPALPSAQSRPPRERRAKNRAIDAENAAVRELRYAPDDPEDQKRTVIAALERWYGEHRERFEYSTGEKFRRFFLDTRFAAYWRNLARLDFGVSLTS